MVLATADLVLEEVAVGLIWGGAIILGLAWLGHPFLSWWERGGDIVGMVILGGLVAIFVGIVCGVVLSLLDSPHG